VVISLLLSFNLKVFDEFQCCGIANAALCQAQAHQCLRIYAELNASPSLAILIEAIRPLNNPLDVILTAHNSVPWVKLRHEVDVVIVRLAA
jgi:hypothetical protein